MLRKPAIWTLALFLLVVAPVCANWDRLPWPDPIRAVGTGKLTWLGMKVYQATLYSDQGRYDPSQPHALAIDYRFSFTREQLVDRSLEEIEQIRGDIDDREMWRQQLQTVMVDVDKGDQLVGVHYPGQKAIFFHNQTWLGEITDPELASFFFAIWLHPKTSEPDLRAQLLGMS